MTDRKREPLANLKPPKFMKPGDDPEVDRALDRLRFDSDIYAPGEYDVFGRRRNLKGLPPSQRDLPPWGAPPQEGTEPIVQPESAAPIVEPESAAPTAPLETADETVEQEHSEPAAPPVAAPAVERDAAVRSRRAKVWVAALAVFAVLAPVTVVLLVVVPRVNPPPSKSSASAPSVSAVAPPTTSATPQATAAPEVSSGAPAIGSATPTTSAAAPLAPSLHPAPTARIKPRGATDNPHGVAAPPSPATSVPVTPAPPTPPAPPPTATTPPELLTN